VNECIFIGNLTRDPEVRSVGTEHRVARFTLAVNSGRKSKEGEEQVAYIDCEVWDKAADVIAKYITKGSKLCVQAVARTESWADKATGSKRSALRFRVHKFHFVGVKTGSSPAAVGAEIDEEAGFQPDNSEEIPF
jgi:single-strand DNA-binding protein